MPGVKKTTWMQIRVSRDSLTKLKTYCKNKNITMSKLIRTYLSRLKSKM